MSILLKLTLQCTLKANVSRVLTTKPEPLTFAHKVKFDSDWVWRRMKCYAPALEILTP